MDVSTRTSAFKRYTAIGAQKYIIEQAQLHGLQAAFAKKRTGQPALRIGKWFCALHCVQSASRVSKKAKTHNSKLKITAAALQDVDVVIILQHVPKSTRVFIVPAGVFRSVMRDQLETTFYIRMEREPAGKGKTAQIDFFEYLEAWERVFPLFG